MMICLCSVLGVVTLVGITYENKERGFQLAAKID